MRLRPLVFGAPVCVVWLFFFTVFPLTAVIVLLMAIAWHDYRRRHAAVGPQAADDQPRAGSK